MIAIPSTIFTLIIVTNATLNPIFICLLIAFFTSMYQIHKLPATGPPGHGDLYPAMLGRPWDVSLAF